MVGVGVALTLGKKVILMWKDVGFFYGARPGIEITCVNLGVEGRVAAAHVFRARRPSSCAHVWRRCVALFLLNYEIGVSKGSELHESVVCRYILSKCVFIDLHVF